MSEDKGTGLGWTSTHGQSQRGYALSELLVVVAVIGILVGMSIPFYMTYLNSATLKAGAEEVVAFLNQGRALAIKENANVCVQISSTQMSYRKGTCSGTPWTGPGTDASGNVSVPAGVALSTTANPVFSYLGAASPAATYTVTNPRNGRTLHVAVAASGRVSIAP